jgi:tetratricopeptide (TPR) repeat protein
VAALHEGLGTHSMPVTTTSELAQRYFDQGMALSYGFNHVESERSFTQASMLDSTCAMAWWGQALVLGPNINAPMDPATNAKALRNIARAQRLMSTATAKEQALIHALSKRYADSTVGLTRGALDTAYADAMRGVAQQFPNDPDVAALFAESLMDLHPWQYWERTGTAHPWTPEIVETLERSIQRFPSHPGLLHMYIHAMEASPTPHKALDAARTLETLVPGAAHLVHMPAHVYIRTGRYHDAIAANERAVKADSLYMAKNKIEGVYVIGYVPHNSHFLSASASFAGMGTLALSSARHMAKHQDPRMMREAGFGALQHFGYFPLYVMVRFGMWDTILAEPSPEEGLKYPAGIWHYARGMAFLRRGAMPDAQRELRSLQRIASDTSLRSVTIWDINSTYDVLQIAVRALEGEFALVKGQHSHAITLFTEAVVIEDKLRYDEPPPWLVPMRESLGAAYLAAKKYADAERVYLEDLTMYPENGWSLYGLREALRAQSRSEEEQDVGRRLATAWRTADVHLTSSRF